MTDNKWRIIKDEYISYYGGTGHLISDGENGFWLWHDHEESQKVCDLLNSQDERKLAEILDDFLLLNRRLFMEYKESNDLTKSELLLINDLIDFFANGVEKALKEGSW